MDWQNIKKYQDGNTNIWFSTVDTILGDKKIHHKNWQNSEKYQDVNAKNWLSTAGTILQYLVHYKNWQSIKRY
jgi:hypothetical protein